MESKTDTLTSYHRIFFRIVLPICVPGIVTAAIFLMITAWNELLFGSILTQDEQAQTIQTGGDSVLPHHLFGQLSAGIRGRRDGHHAHRCGVHIPERSSDRGHDSGQPQIAHGLVDGGPGGRWRAKATTSKGQRATRLQVAHVSRSGWTSVTSTSAPGVTTCTSFSAKDCTLGRFLPRYPFSEKR
jgi:hypothetical protein